VSIEQVFHRTGSDEKCRSFQGFLEAFVLLGIVESVLDHLFVREGRKCTVVKVDESLETTGKAALGSGAVASSKGMTLATGLVPRA